VSCWQLHHCLVVWQATSSTPNFLTLFYSSFHIFVCNSSWCIMHLKWTKFHCCYVSHLRKKCV
jgi:hypothetical protein